MSRPLADRLTNPAVLLGHTYVPPGSARRGVGSAAAPGGTPPAPSTVAPVAAAGPAPTRPPGRDAPGGWAPEGARSSAVAFQPGPARHFPAELGRVTPTTAGWVA